MARSNYLVLFTLVSLMLILVVQLVLTLDDLSLQLENKQIATMDRVNIPFMGSENSIDRDRDLKTNSELTPSLRKISSENSVQQQTTIVLSPLGQIVSGSVKYGTFDLYSITISSWSCLSISFKLPSYPSSVSVYVKQGLIPTQYNYDYSILTQYYTKDIYPVMGLNSSTFYIAVYGDFSNQNSYVLTTSVSSFLPGWMIGVIVGSAIMGLLLLLVAFVVPVFICLGICRCLCATTPTNRNAITTYTTVHTPILSTPVTPVYYEQQDTAYYNPNVVPNYPQHQPQYVTYQKFQ